MFADFDTNDAGLLYLRRISFDGHGCCNLAEIRPMNPADSHRLIDSFQRNAFDETDSVALLRYYANNRDLIWEDALSSHGLS